jgi:ABC-2 type transport system ATP-binding protein
MIRVTNLTKRYGATLALDALSLTVPDGSVFGLVGPNGSGKSTLFRLLMGFIFPDTGAIDLGSFPPRQIGYTPDRPFLPLRFRLEEYLLTAARLSGLDGRAARQASALRLQQVGLSEVARWRIGALSKGMAQRLSLAAALLHDPPLLLLDEPMGGLDPAQQAAIRALIGSLQGEGKTVLLSTHRLSEVADICTHVGILRRGRLVLTGALPELLAPHPHVTIRVDRLPDELAAQLAAQYPDLGLQDSTVTLNDAAIQYKNEILRALMDAGCDIQQLVQQHATLEQVYLAAVQHAAEPQNAERREAAQ